MEKHYQPIDGKNITFDKFVIEEVFGAAGDVIDARSVILGKPVEKYSFYNTGELCEVIIEDKHPVMSVSCHGNRKKEVLNWLKQYLTNGMKSYGWETDIIAEDSDSFYAAFYQEEEV